MGHYEYEQFGFRNENPFVDQLQLQHTLNNIQRIFSLEGTHIADRAVETKDNMAVLYAPTRMTEVGVISVREVLGIVDNTEGFEVARLTRDREKIDFHTLLWYGNTTWAVDGNLHQRNGETYTLERKLSKIEVLMTVDQLIYYYLLQDEMRKYWRNDQQI